MQLEQEDEMFVRACATAQQREAYIEKLAKSRRTYSRCATLQCVLFTLVLMVNTGEEIVTKNRASCILPLGLLFGFSIYTMLYYNLDLKIKFLKTFAASHD